jgi:hypothetical protein
VTSHLKRLELCEKMYCLNMSSEMLRRVVWPEFIDVSKVLTASIIRAVEAISTSLTLVVNRVAQSV